MLFFANVFVAFLGLENPLQRSLVLVVFYVCCNVFPFLDLEIETSKENRGSKEMCLMNFYFFCSIFEVVWFLLGPLYTRKCVRAKSS